MGKGKLHELLAVEADQKGRAENIMNETRKVFKEKPNLFNGFVRTFKPFTDDGIDYPQDHLKLTSTVDEKLAYACATIVKYYDVLLQKETTNQVALADLVVNGEVIATSLPATFLLGMESRLKKLRDVYVQIPTLAVGTEWKSDESKGAGVYTTVNPEETLKAVKTIKSKVLYPAQFPKEGEGGQSIPAVIDKWDESENVGKYSKTYWSGMVTSARKSQLLDRIDTLLQAVKKARQRANNTEVVNVTVGKKLMDFINK